MYSAVCVRTDHGAGPVTACRSGGDFPGAVAPDREHRIDAGGVAPRRPRVGRRGSRPAVPGARRVRLRPHLRRVRPQAGGRRLACRGLGSARPRRQRPRRAVLVGRRPPRRDGRDGRDHAAPGTGDRALQGRVVDDPAGRRPAVPLHATWSTSTASRTSAASPTWPSTSAPGWWPARSPAGSTTGARTADLAAQAGHARGAGPSPGRMNPRLSFEWLCHLVTVGALESADGWRWKIDASMRFGGFGPWRPEWTLTRLPGLADAVPRRARQRAGGDGLGHVPTPRAARSCPIDGRFEVLDGVGHFVHIEQPDLVAGMVLDFLGGGHERAPGRAPHHHAAPQQDQSGAAPPARRSPAGRCCCSTASARRHPTTCRTGQPNGRDRWPLSTSPVTGGRPCRPAAGTAPRSCWPTPTPRWPNWARRRSSAAASVPTWR